MKTKFIVGVMVLGGMAIWALAQANNPMADAGSPIRGIVESLDRIYEAVGSISDVPAVEQREGFCKSLEVAGDSNEIVLVVSEGEQFILRKLYAIGGLNNAEWTTQWFLAVDNNLFIDGKINYFGWEEKNASHKEICRFVHDFPDKCVVVDAGQTLQAFNGHSWEPLQITVIGYFYNIE